MATAKVVVGGSSVTAGQMKDFWRQVDDGSVNFTSLQAFLEHRNPFDISALDWAKVYNEVLCMPAEYAKFAKANEAALAGKPGLWTMPVFKGVTCNKVIAAFQELGVDVYQYIDNLDADVTKNDRDPNNGSYIVSFAANVEADENLKNLSADVLAGQDVKGITLLERLLLGLAYFLTTGKHLDVENVTLCAGSRRSGGAVPDVGWDVDGRELCVGWYHSECASGALRARAVVS